MRSRKLLALIFSLLAIAPALAGYMTLLGAGVGSIQPVASWVSTTDPTFPSSSLTFSRTSLATMFDSTGKLTYAPNNLLTYSNTFSNPAWAKISVTVTGGVSDPFGGTNAFTVKANSSGGNSFIYQYVTGIAGMNLLETVWIRRRTGTGAVNFFANNGITGTAIPVTGTWQQLTNVVVGLETTSVGFILATINDEIDIYAATASVVTYETAPRSNDQVITTSAAYYGPRIDYDPNTLAVKGLLIEEARTNFTTRSGELTHADWGVAGLTRGSDATLDPTGATAVKLSSNAAGGTPHNLFNGPSVSITSGSTYVQSWNVKAGTHSKVLVNAGDGTNYSAAIFDISGTSDGTATQLGQDAAGAGVAGTSKYLGNGWFRLSLKFTAGATSNRYTVVAFAPALTGNTFNDYGDVLYTAAGTETIYVGQPQFELGSFASSYIPTAASSVTRAADVVQFTGAALTALQGSAGSAITETISLSDTSPASITNLIRGTNSILYRDTTGKTGTTNGTTALLTAAAPTWNVSLRNGLAWSAAGRSLVYTSGAVATDANAVSNGGTLYLGSNNGSAVENGWYKSFAVYNQRLSDAALQAKSVVGASYAANDNGVRFAFANDNLPVHWRIAL